MDNDFLANLPKEGEEAFENKEEEEKETPPAPPAEEKPEEEQPASQEAGDNTPDDSKLPFHKHPRWIERENELESLRREIEELRTPKEEPTEAKPDDWFKDAFGENEDLWKKFSSYTTSLKQEIKAEFVREQQEKVQQEQSTLQTLSAKFDSDIQELRDEGKKFDEAKLRNIAAEYFPTDENGIVSIRKAYGIYEALHSKEGSERSAAKKAVASRTSSDERGGSSDEGKEYLTAAEARKLSW